MHGTVRGGNARARTRVRAEDGNVIFQTGMGFCAIVRGSGGYRGAQQRRPARCSDWHCPEHRTRRKNSPVSRAMPRRVQEGRRQNRPRGNALFALPPGARLPLHALRPPAGLPYGDEIDHLTSEAFDAWTLELRDNDGFSREIELENMGMPQRQRVQLITQLRLCAVWLSNIELTDKATLHRLVKAEEIPTDNPVAHNAALVAKLDRETAKRQADIMADFARPVAQLDSPGPLVLWQVKKTADESDFPRDFAGQIHDGLGRVGMTPNTWHALAEKNAPNWLI